MRCKVTREICAQSAVACALICKFFRCARIAPPRIWILSVTAELVCGSLAGIMLLIIYIKSQCIHKLFKVSLAKGADYQIRCVIPQTFKLDLKLLKATLKETYVYVNNILMSNLKPNLMGYSNGMNQGKKFKSGRLSKRPLATSLTCIGARLGDSTVY